MQEIAKERIQDDNKRFGLQAEISAVTVAGITGAVGPAIIQALLEAGFQVQALTHNASIATSFLPGVKLVEVDYSNQVCLRNVLADQDAVVSTLGDTTNAVAAQEALIEASIAAGVKRFIPSEFGSDTTNERVGSFPFFGNKVRHQELLKEAAVRAPNFTYSIIITGPLLDWGLRVVPFIINVGARSADMYDGGDVAFSMTRTTILGKAIVATLQKFEATANRVIKIHDAIITQNQLIACEQRSTGNVEFSRTYIDCKALEEQAWRAFNNPSSDPLSWILPFVNISIWSKEELCAFQSTDNGLLGIQEVKGSELDALLAHEISMAIKAFSSTDDVSLATSPSCRASARKALEDGKQKLIDTPSKVSYAIQQPL